jgi:hypothetical protein
LSPAEIIERERRYAPAAALAAFLAVALFLFSLVLLTSKFGADGNAELLRKVDGNSGTLVLTYVLRGLGSALLAVPFAYLFRAAQARSESMRGQFIGLVIAAPLFLAAFAVFTGLSLHDAAPDFIAKGAAHHLGNGDHADKVAGDVIDDSAFRELAAGFGIGGALGFAFAMAYTCLHATRVGLLPRFWGTLGLALGVASILFFQYTLIWVVYLGLLIAGRVPRGRPPAWAAGEAIPWPTPGEQMAERMSGEEESTEGGEPETEDEQAADLEAPEEETALHRPRKRKRRSDS